MGLLRCQGRSIKTERALTWTSIHAQTIDSKLVQIFFLYFKSFILSYKVIASEDWKGMREDFKTASEILSFKLDFTPKVSVSLGFTELTRSYQPSDHFQLVRPPVVKERRIRLRRPEVARGSSSRHRRHRTQREALFEEIGRTPSPPRPPPVKIPYNIWWDSL